MYRLYSTTITYGYKKTRKGRKCENIMASCKKDGRRREEKVKPKKRKKERERKEGMDGRRERKRKRIEETVVNLNKDKGKLHRPAIPLHKYR